MVHAGWSAVSWIDCADCGGAEPDETVGAREDAFGEGGGGAQRGIGGSESRARGDDAYRSADQRAQPAVFSGDHSGGRGADGAELYAGGCFEGAAESRFDFLFD